MRYQDAIPTNSLKSGPFWSPLLICYWECSESVIWKATRTIIRNCRFGLCASLLLVCLGTLKKLSSFFTRKTSFLIWSHKFTDFRSILVSLVNLLLGVPEKWNMKSYILIEKLPVHRRPPPLFLKCFCTANRCCTFPGLKQVVPTKILQIKQKCSVFETKQGKCTVATSKIAISGILDIEALETSPLRLSDSLTKLHNLGVFVDC